MRKIRAIETHYKGYRFRSRLEARWAVYFDTLGIDWEYEKEGYDLGKLGWYLPDFWLPQVDMWAEVKGKKFTKKEIKKCEALDKMTGYACLFLQGVPDYCVYFATNDMDYLVTNHHGYHINEHRFFVNCGCARGYPEPFGAVDWMVDGEFERAITNARSARFEHGETPRNY